ncbi:MAG: aquaporin [Fimbriimonadaceae bacterium]|nr:aquaporin [Fimbriimonadaceae bacterium]
MKVFTEFIGSFLFMLAIPLAIGNAGNLAPLAIGAALMVMVYMGGHVSGAHYNPAVTLAVWLRGKMDLKDVVPYIVAQILGAIAAFFMGYWLLGSAMTLAPGEAFAPAKALAVEILFTCMLVTVILNVATAKATAGNSYYGLAIGFTIVAAAFVGGPISGGAFNPAVGIGATVSGALFGDGNWSNLWLYLVGPFVGAGLGVLIFKAQHGSAEASASEAASA